jgi:hypothetical protein
MAAHSTIKLAAIEPLLNPSQAAAIVAGHYSEPVELARTQVAQVRQSQLQAGF